jgi:hypothetical protein
VSWDLCSSLLGLLCFLITLAAVGHGLWLLGAAVLRRLLPPDPSAPAGDRRLESCVRCGNPHAVGQSQCPYCRFNLASPLAVELRELEAAARRIQDLQDRRLLDPAVGEQVYQCIEKRQQVLLRGADRPARTADAPATPAEEADVLTALPAEAPAEVIRIRPISPFSVPPAPAEPPPVSPPASVREAAPAAPVVPPAPRRSLGELLAAFMEQRNILWGELVGGLLIVGCSIALVISLWRTLEQVPYFPFLILAAVTGLVFGAGWYTLRHWKLETTSRGLLVIGTLLVPLDFLVLARLSGSQGAGLLEVITDVAAVAGFTALVGLAARVLAAPALAPGRVPAGWLATLAVLGASASQLLVPRLLDAAAPPGRVLLVGLLSAACPALVLANVLRGLHRRPRLDADLAWSLFGLLGLTTFALAVALGLLIQWSGDLPQGLHALALPGAVAGVPLLAGGALVRRKLDEDALPPDDGVPTTARVAATCVTLAGTGVLLAAVGLAWPAPWALILVGGLNAAALTAVALGYRLRIIYLPALLCLGLSCLTLFHLAGGTPEDAGNASEPLLRELASPASGSALAALAVVLAAAAELLVRSGRRADGIIHAAAAGVGGVLALLLVTWDGTAEPGRAAVVYGVCAVGGPAANARWLRPLLSYAGAAVLVGVFAYALHAAFPGLTVPRLLLLALLAQATGLLVAARLLAACGPGAALPAFIVPFRHAALAASLLAAPALFLAAGWGWLTPAALAAFWLAAVWLVLAWWEGRPDLFAAFQAALSVAVGLGVTSWLEGQEWVGARLDPLLDPRSLHAYGVGLAGLGLAWAAARLGLRGSARARALLEPWSWPALDRVVSGTLILGQLGLAVWGGLPDVLRELTPAGLPVPDAAWPPEYVHALGPGAWVVLALLAAGLGAGLWDRPSRERLLGLGLLALTVPVLAAGWFRDDLAAASALRWGFALCLVACSALVWGRDRVAYLAGRLGIPSAQGEGLSTSSRRLLVAGAVPPVLLLTAVVAVLGFSGQTPSGPAAGSFFARVGWLGSQVIPLLLLTVGLAGHGVRERSPGYAFAAGLVADVSLVGGYALGVRHWTDAEVVRLCQLGALGAALWALAWLASRPWLAAWREEPGRPLARILMWVQLGIGVAGSAVFLGVGLWLLMATLPGEDVAPGTVTYPPAWGWTVEAGSLLGWAALGLTVMAVAVQLRPKPEAPARGPSKPEAPARDDGFPSLALQAWVVGLAAVGLLACSLEGHFPGWGFRALLLGWTVYLLAWALWLYTDTRTPGEWGAAAAAWAGLLGVLVLLLALKAAVIHQDQPWAAGSLGLAAAACAVVAGARRQEAWAFAAGVGANLTASLLVWHAYAGAPLPAWAVLLVQTNLLVAGSAALAWLALRKRLYNAESLTPTTSPLLALQVSLGVEGNAVLLALPLLALLADPAAPLPAELLPVGRLTGWLALLVAVLPALWYCRLALPPAAVHVTAVGGLLLGVVAACAVKPAGPPTGWDAWLPHHVLTLTWTLLGLLLLAAGWAGAALPRLGPITWTPERRAQTAALLAALFPARPARRWVEIVCLLVVGLALRGAWSDPTRPYLSSLATLAVSVLLGALALWSRRPVYVYASGLMFNLVGYLVWQSWLTDEGNAFAWLTWGPGVAGTLLYGQVLCLALAAAFWTAADLALRRRTPPVDLRGRFLPFSHAAALLALHLLAVIILGGVASDATDTGLRVGGALAWAALGATAAALLLCLWDFEAAPRGLPAPPLYAAGLLAVGLALHAAGLPLPELVRQAALALAVYVLAAATIGRAFSAAPRVWSALHLPNRPERWPAPWLVGAQALTVSLVVGLSLGACLAADTTPERLSGAVAVLLLLPAGVLLAGGRGTKAGAHRPVCYATLALGVLALTEAGWALLDPAGPAPWLHRSVVLLTALALAGLLYGVVLPWLSVARAPGWDEAARRTAPVLGALAAVVLGAVLVQEFVLYDPDPLVRRTPMAWPAVVVVAATLAALIAALLYLALHPKQDPLGPTTTGRPGYVYGSEVLLVLLLVHLRLTIPDIFPPLLGQYWPLTIMVIAFLGMGLGELFGACGLPLLAAPLRRTGLFLPLLPLLAYLVRPLADLRVRLGEAVPGLQPFLRFLERLPAHYGMPALVWFLLGLLYALLAVRQRSSRLGLLAALAANFGLWTVLGGNREHLGFLVHPQLWLVPLGLILLAAEQLHRPQLTAAQGQALRCGGALVIYVASTADMFVAGLGNSVLLPVALALLAVLGVLAGILLRVRAFLFLGAAFLFVVVFAQIWHAAVDRAQTWLWWASGVVLGAAIVTLFAVFEKRRDDLLRMMEGLKRWD